MKRPLMFAALLILPAIAFAASSGDGGCGPLCAAWCYLNGGCAC